MRTFVGGTFCGLARLTVTLVILMAAIAGASPVQAKNLRIAMILWHPETPAEAGFKDELKKLGYTVDYVVIDAQQDRTALRSKIESEILPQLKSFDYIYSYGTTVTQVTKVLLGGQAPQLFDIVYDPVGSGFVESLTAPGGNITGASDAVPLSAELQPFLKLFKLHKLAVLFNPRENNSNLQLQGLQQAAKEHGFDVIELPSPPALETLQQNLKSLTDGQIKVDAVYLPADSFLLSQAGLIGPQLRAAKIKSLAALQGFVDQGVLMGVVPNYRELGEALARMIDENRKGKPLGHIAVYFTQQPTLAINTTTAAALGIEIPDSVRSKAILVTGPEEAPPR